MNIEDRARALLGTRRNPSRARLLIVVIVGVVIGLLLPHGVVDRSQPPIVDTPVKKVFCIEEGGLPCTYKPGGLHDAFIAGALGPKSITVPSGVRAAIRAAVHNRGATFEATVKEKAPWYQAAVWSMNCTPVIGLNQVMGEDYFRCPTPDQLSARFSKIGRIALACSQTSIVAAGIGSAIATKGALVGAISGGLTCAADDLLTAGRTWFGEDLGDGYSSAKPGSHWLPVTLPLRW